MSDNNTTKMLISAWFSEDKASIGQYLQASEKIFLEHGMVGATRYGSGTTVVGEFQPDAVVMLEWEDGERCQQAFTCDEYTALLNLRDKAFKQLNINILNG
jgi:uncharacterized protein (DUF1330 family)